MGENRRREKALERRKERIPRYRELQAQDR